MYDDRKFDRMFILNLDISLPNVKYLHVDVLDYKSLSMEDVISRRITSFTSSI